MAVDDPGEQRPACRIERDRRLVEKPHGPWRQQETGKRQTPLLAGRQVAGANRCEIGEAKARERGLSCRWGAAQVGGPELGVLRDGQRWLDAIEMADEMAVLAGAEARLALGPVE